MSKQLLFEDASLPQIELAKDIRNRILTELKNISMDDFQHINNQHLSKEYISNYVQQKDDVYYFIQNKNVATHVVIVNTILNINRGK